ncbi:Glycosyltransferase involved in cell wall bisynthesis [Chitinophaga sp. CF118]|uniref:glycosyltransferase family 4 protein n=1 Tax=Chitinophaga sp. CF118 TaxID=1884367 RepID=UPI0008EA9BA9|nr:glycosyltransferase family 1 protein [Chitinophaga sp. CF118]SFD64854.1 Glycosyltransferase involved in cell wall bisynthesis [Chitinophaga sp. CF118]
MNIAFDAKRAFQNNTGLGNYSRTLISSLATYYPTHNYYLYAPKLTGMYATDTYRNMHTVLPEKRLHRWFRSAWRSKYVVGELAKKNISIYHGLSHEIPFGIHESGVKSVVTMHDLIFERYPGQYNPIDVLTYRRKAKYASQYADKIIAISEQTKEDLINYYNTPADKITVVYQSCDEMFAIKHTESRISEMRTKYKLPPVYFLYVGSIIERKNLLSIMKAMLQLKGNIDIPLVVLGNGSGYKKKVKEFVAAHDLSDRVIWLNEQAKFAYDDLPVLYQGAKALIYPSIFEGFGIPILEALWSRTPVITSKSSCFLETAGDAAVYIDPLQPQTLAEGMKLIVEDTEYVEELKIKGWAHAQLFTREKCAAGVIKVYESL